MQLCCRLSALIASVDAEQGRPAAVGDLAQVVEADGIPVVDPLKRHASHIGPQDLLGVIADFVVEVQHIKGRPYPAYIACSGSKIKFPRSHSFCHDPARCAGSRPAARSLWRGVTTLMPVTIGVIRETAPGEARVAVVPEVAKKLAAGRGPGAD